MTNEFSHDPIKLRIVDIKTGSWKQSYVFVGFVPNDVARELNKLEKNLFANSTILKKFYGAGWRYKLGIDSLHMNSVKSRKYKGGEEYQIDEDFLNDLDLDLDFKSMEETAEQPEQPEQTENTENTEKTIKSKPDNVEKPYNVEKPEKPDLEDLDLEIDSNIKIDVLAEKIETLEVSHAGGVKFITDIDITPADNILEFKTKLYLSIGIPIYRQHIWFKYRNRSYPLNYVFSVHKHVENIDIETLISFYKDPTETKLDAIENIPIDINYYNNKDYIHISARDTFELLRNIYYKYSTNEFYLTDLNDLLNPTELYTKLHKDKYQLELIYYGFVVLYFPMISYSVFYDYIKNEKSIREIYPDLLPEKLSIRNMFQVEGDITSEAYELLDNNTLDKKIFSSITATTVSISNYNQDVDVVLSLRNLFDVLELNENITYCKANLLHENHNIILKKAYMNEREPKDLTIINTILIKIKINPDTNENIRLIIYKNGNYVVKTDWREENHMDFKKITKVVSAKINPIIKLINKYGEKVKYHKIDLVELDEKNILFTETSISFYYDDDTTEARFNVLKQVLDDFRKANIISSKENTVSTIGIEYFFNKGMYKYDPNRIEKSISVDNYYEFLSSGMVKQKWESVFVRTRLLQIINISSKLKIQISGIRDDVEMDFFYMYLKAILEIYTRSASHIKVISSETMNSKSKRALKNLKVQDPLLYDFKKIYKSNVIYSKICQKPYQPLILSDEEYSKLPKDKKSKALKYWNFTTQKPVWYSCPNLKYPYIKFIVKQHPKDFCIPCCKKIEMNDSVNIKKQEIHNTCMVSHQYTGEKVNLTKGSHYIASYGKNIEPGRISRLPENTLEPLFFDTYSSDGTGGIDQECITADGYYLFGVDQHTVHIDNIGMLYVLSNALGVSVRDFIDDAIERINKNPNKFRVLLDGNAALYFKDVNSMCDLLYDIADENAVMEETLNDKIPWNELLKSIAYYYFGINTIMFDDQHKEMIELVLPKGLKNYDQMFPDSHKNLVVLRKKVKYYPIYLFNTEIFKRTGIIDTKLFLNESGLITIIRAIVKRDFETHEFEKIKNVIDLVACKEFCKDYKLHIKHYYINYSNLCYACVINYNKTDLYFPISNSHYPLEKNISLIFTPYKGEYDVNYPVLKHFLHAFYKWNQKKSQEAKLEGILLYPKVEVQQWLKYHSSIVGFMFNNTNYYIKPISEQVARKFEDSPVQNLLYHPYQINNLIHQVKQGKIQVNHLPANSAKLNKSLYDFYLYNIVLMHYISIFNDQRNTTFRAKLSAILSKTDFNKDLSKLRDFIDDIKDLEDIVKIKNIISRYVSIHHDKKQMLKDIQNTYFNFDKISLEQLRNKTQPQIYESLQILGAKFVKFGTPKINKFPNMFMACDSNEKLAYCDKNKLIIEKPRFNEIVQIIASEIVNPAKWKWIFSNAFIIRSVNYFKFIRRKNESIEVEFLS